MWAEVSILGYHMTPQEFFSGKLTKGIVRSTFWGRKRRSLTWAVFFLIVLNLTYHPRYNARVTMLSEPSPKHCQYQFFLCCSVTQACLTLCDSMYSKNPRLAALQIAHSFLKPMTFESVMLCSHLVLCPTLLLLPPIPPRISVFSNESTLCMRWPKYWSFSFSISPSNEHPGLISFRMHCLMLFIFLTQ